MRTRVIVAASCALIATACGGGSGNGDGDVRARGETAPADGEGATRTPDIDAAPEGGVSLPREGTYVYHFESRQTNAATPNATPRRSSPDAEFTSKVSVEDDVATFVERTSEGDAESTRELRWHDDGVVELSLALRANEQTSGCDYDEPLMLLRIPIKKERLPKQELSGTGQACGGERTVTVEGQEDVLDDVGLTWKTWKIEIDTVVVPKGAGLTRRSTETRWFSPDLGREIRSEAENEYIDPDGKVAIRNEQSLLLTSFPEA